MVAIPGLPMTGSEKKLRVLLTNDDGIQAPGLWALFDVLREKHDVTVVAPDRERSAVGHGITLNQPLRAGKASINGGNEGWEVSGTPVDCVKLALNELLDKRPDVVVSGINPGPNIGINLNYSGTVAAAKEAALYGFPALAVSVERAEKIHFATAARIAVSILDKLPALGLPRHTFLNINVPNKPIEQIAGTRLSRQANDLYGDIFEKRRDPRNQTYYWQGCESIPAYSYADADGAVLAANYVSITPVRCDMTDFDALKQLKTLEI